MNYNDLQEGDLVRALITDEGLPDHKREHSFILISPPHIKDPGKRRHRICIPACSFSSKIPGGQDKHFLDITSFSIPPDLFDEVKENTILRISEPKCIEKYQYRGYKKNLKEYPEFWKAICQIIHEFYSGNLKALKETCDCECFVNNEIIPGYCNQDDAYLQEVICQSDETVTCKICPCCTFQFDNIEHSYELCPRCEGNYVVELINGAGRGIFIFYGEPDIICQSDETVTCKSCPCCKFQFDNIEHCYELCPRCGDNYVVELINDAGRVLFIIDRSPE